MNFPLRSLRMSKWRAAARFPIDGRSITAGLMVLPTRRDRQATEPGSLPIFLLPYPWPSPPSPHHCFFPSSSVSLIITAPPLFTSPLHPSCLNLSPDRTYHEYCHHTLRYINVGSLLSSRCNISCVSDGSDAGHRLLFMVTRHVCVCLCTDPFIIVAEGRPPQWSIRGTPPPPAATVAAAATQQLLGRNSLVRRKKNIILRSLPPPCQYSVTLRTKWLKSMWTVIDFGPPDSLHCVGVRGIYIMKK